RLQVPMIVGVARVHLVDVVIDVGHHARRHHAGEPHRLELQPGQWAVGVGQEHLVDGEANLLAEDRLAGDEVALDQLARETSAHHSTWGGASAAPPPSPPTASKLFLTASPAG